MMDMILRKYNYEESIYAGRMVGDRGKGEINQKNIFEQLEKINFENHFFYVISNYDSFLTNLYGEYMVLPPACKRYTHHEFEAFKDENI